MPHNQQWSKTKAENLLFDRGKANHSVAVLSGVLSRVRARVVIFLSEKEQKHFKRFSRLRHPPPVVTVEGVAGTAVASALALRGGRSFDTSTFASDLLGVLPPESSVSDATFFEGVGSDRRFSKPTTLTLLGVSGASSSEGVAWTDGPGSDEGPASLGASAEEQRKGSHLRRSGGVVGAKRSKRTGRKVEAIGEELRLLTAMFCYCLTPND